MLNHYRAYDAKEDNHTSYFDSYDSPIIWPIDMRPRGWHTGPESPDPTSTPASDSSSNATDVKSES
jgi:hypothetical protein